MKKYFSILFCLLFSLSLSAHTENNASTSGGSYEAENSTESKELGTNDKTESTENDGAGTEPDSSYYSVNKFNFLFYFVYKMKYMDEEEVNPTND